MINILNADKLINNAPKLYATFLLWLLSALFERLPNVVDRALIYPPQSQLTPLTGSEHGQIVKQSPL